MTTDVVFAAAEVIGCRVALKDGKPVLLGPQGHRRDKLLAVLRHHREAIVERLAPPPLPDIIWWQAPTEPVVWSTLPRREQRLIPYGARAWQLSGDAAWRPLDTLPPEWDIRARVPNGDQSREGD